MLQTIHSYEWNGYYFSNKEIVFPNSSYKKSRDQTWLTKGPCYLLFSGWFKDSHAIKTRVYLRNQPFSAELLNRGDIKLELCLPWE